MAFELSDLIKNRMKELGLKQKDIAQAVGVNESTVSRWINGEIAGLRQGRIIALAKVLNVETISVLEACPRNLNFQSENNFPLPRVLNERPELIELLTIASQLKKEDVMTLTTLAKRFK